MGTGYTRNDTGNNIADGNVINAADFDGEYDAIEAAFNSSTGHTHDGTSAEGAPIEVLGPSQDVVITASVIRPKTTNTVDLGTTSLKFKDAHFEGQVNVDGGFTPNQISVKSTDTGNSKGPQLDIFRESASPADNDALGHIDFSGEDDGDNKTIYASILATANDVTDGTEDGSLKFNTMVAGSDTTVMEISSGSVSITNGTNDAQLTLISTDADANDGPLLVLNRNSSSPADGDKLGQIQFLGEDDADNSTIFGSIVNQIKDASNGSEDGRMSFNLISAGSDRTFFNMTHDGTQAEVVVNEDSRDIDFRVESDDDTHALFVQGSSGNIGIGTSTPSSLLELVSDDATNTGVTQQLTLTHTTTGTAGDGIGTRMTFESEDDGGTKSTMGHIDTIFTDVSDGAEKSAFVFSTRNGGSISEAMRIGDTGSVTITNGTNDTQLTLVSTDADANVGPLLVMNRNSSSPADNDQLGKIQFLGEDDADNSTIYSQIVNQIKDATNGTERGRMSFNIITAGADRSFINMTHDSTQAEVVINEESIDLDFRVETNGKTHMMFIDGGNDVVQIGSSFGMQSPSFLGVRRNGSGIEFGHNNNGSGFYGTIGSFGNSGAPYIGFSTFVEDSANTFTTTGHKGTVINGDASGNLSFSTVNTASATGQTPTQRAKMGTTEFVFNDSSDNYDFRVETDNKTHGLFLDASTNILHLGGSTQAASTSFINCGGVTFSNGSASGGAFLSWDNEGGTSSQSLLGYYFDGSSFRNRFRVAGNTDETTVNGSGDDINFRVESNNQANMFVVDAENDLVKIGSTNGGAQLNVNVGITATDPQFCDFRNLNSGQDMRVICATNANSSGDPYIKFDAGGSNMIVGLHWKGTTNNELRMGAADRPNETIKGIRVKGNGSTFISTTDYEGQLDTSDTGEVGHAWNASNGSYVLQRDANSTGSESILLNNIHSSGAVINVLQYRTRNTVEGSIHGTSSGLSFSNVSDYRKKENVTDATGCLGKINGLRPVTYTHRSEYDSDTTTVHTGFIAHEVSDHLPSIVNGTKDAVDGDGNAVLQSLSYADHEMIANLVGAIKELKAENDAMRSRLDALEG
mgnify:CR=1 FL=1